jgi:hypothetical protein
MPSCKQCRRDFKAREAECTQRMPDSMSHRAKPKHRAPGLEDGSAERKQCIAAPTHRCAEQQHYVAEREHCVAESQHRTPPMQPVQVIRQPEEIAARALGC